MVRTVTKEYQVWLAGFYDDFNGARAIPDDRNAPTDSSYSALKSHYGNPLNGEAFLNPRFRFSLADRVQDSGLPANMSVATSSNQYLQNDGIFEWLTSDDTRISFHEYEGRSQLQFPDGHVANRYKFNNDTSDYSEGYQRFINGHDSTASYIVPTGDNDSSYGREESLDYTDANYNNKQAGSTTANDFENRFMQRAHLAGVFMGEVLELGPDSGTAAEENTPANTFHELHSPAKSPFLVIQSARHNFDSHSPNVPTLIYDGPLNTRLDGDFFTARVALHSTMATNPTSWDEVGIKFEIGFSSSQAGICNDDGYTGTPAIDYTLDLNSLSYDTTAYLGATNDDQWLDVDFRFDYSANTFNVYVDGTAVATNQTMSGGSATTAANLYGYQLTVTNESGSSGNNGYVTYLMIDRVGMVRYLTDDFTRVDPANINHPVIHVQNLDIRQSTNGISTCRVSIADDAGSAGSVRGNDSADYILNLRSLFVATEPLDWSLLVFANPDIRIDRPIWRGKVSDFDIKQGNDRSRIITFNAKDSIEELANQIPLWDMGQINTPESGTDADYWTYDAEGYRDAMNLGAGKLKMLGKDIGFDTESSYIASSTQRTQLGSGHPIQMYNNEDTFGPNNAEDDYEGFGIKGFVQPAGSAASTVAIVYKSGHGQTTSSTFDIIDSTSHNATSISPTAVDGTTGDLTFSSSDLAYTAQSSKIFYIGKYPGLDSARASYWNNLGSLGGIEQQAWSNIYNAGPSASHPTGTGPLYMHVYFETDPGLEPHDKFFINFRNDGASASLSSSYQVQHTVKSVIKYRSYLSVNAGTISNPGYFWVVKTTTPYSGTESHGSYATDNFMTSSARFSWNNDTGIIKGVFGTNASALKQRAIHARWMRDLPKSLWFQYHFGKIKSNASGATYGGIKTGQGTITSTTKMIEITSAAYSAASSSGGVVEIWKWPGTGPINSTNQNYIDKLVYQGKITYTVGGTDKYYLIGCKYLNTDIVSESVVNFFTLRFQDIDTDYKHIWLLWSDMRNDGNADADGTERKQSFGLQYPIEKNYEFDLYFADQVDNNGNPQKFGDLKSGEDFNLWSLDATQDPCTGSAWSKPVDYANGISLAVSTPLSNSSGKLKISTASSSGTAGFGAGDYVYLLGSASHDGYHVVDSVGVGFLVTTTDFSSATMQLTGGTTSAGYIYPATGSEKDLTEYHDWENKAGSFLVIDTAKFFNLNTHANSGKTGQTSGGNTDLTDYIARREGFPALIDNYWREAIASFGTTADVVFQHPNQTSLISDVVIAPDGFIQGAMGIALDDTTDFHENGVGRLVTVYDRNNNGSGNDDRFFTWENILRTQYDSSSGIDNPITNTTYQGETVIEVTNAGETHEAGGIKAGMILQKTPAGGGTATTHNILAVGDTSGANTDTKLVVQKNATDGTSVTWSLNDTYVVPEQIGKVFEVSISSVSQAVNTTIQNLEQEIWNQFANTPNTWSKYGINSGFTSGSGTTPVQYEVHSTVGSDYMLRLMMHINGFYKSKAGGTYWNSDKLRMLWNAAVMDTWLPSVTVNCIFGINNVPITSHMSTYNDTSSNDYYGSIVDARGKTLGETLRAIQEKASQGESNYTTFSYLMGRDNRLELRPNYSSGLTFNRENVRISNMSANMNKQIKNVRVFYNSGKSFVDFPAVSLTDSTKWSILDMPNITNSEEALIVAKQEYNKRKNNSLRVSVEPIIEAGKNYKMIETGRYGYIADPYIALDANNDSVFTLVTHWGRLGTGGVLFPGMVNALDGNMNVDYTDLKTRYGTSKRTNSSGNVDWDKNYYWYGSNSISHAIQIVHIPNNVPFDSDTTSEQLRIWVDLKASQAAGATIDTAEFTVTVADYGYSGNARTVTTPVNNSSTKDVKHSGFYEIDIPQSYSSAQGKIVFSFNAEYCRALLRHRCGDPDDSNILAQVATNTNTIFPIGKRVYSEFSNGFKEDRVLWYAPRIHITRDLSYVPATRVTMTDLGIESNAETLVIKEVSYNAMVGQTESVSLQLERDEGLEHRSLMTYLFNQNSVGMHNSGGVGVGNSDSGGIYGDNPNPGTPPVNTPDAPSTPREQEGEGYEDNTEGTDIDAGNGANQMSGNFYRRIFGSTELFGDNLSGNSKLSILGQNKIASVTPHLMKGIEGMNSDVRPATGGAFKSAEGYVFSAKGLMGTEASNDSAEVTMRSEFKIPTDVLTDRINVEGMVTHSPEIAAGTIGVLYTTVKVKETGYSVSHTTDIGTGLSKKSISLLPTQALNGANIAGNTIEITVTRKPGLGSDTSDTSSIVLHDIDVNMQRASSHTKTSISQFRSKL